MMAMSIRPSRDAGFAAPNPAGWKAALHAVGQIGSPALRAPLTAAPPDLASALVAAVGNVPSAAPARKATDRRR